MRRSTRRSPWVRKRKNRERLTALIFTALVVIAALVACGPSWRTPVHSTFNMAGVSYICVDLPDNQLSQANEAILAWDKSIGSWRRLKYVKGQHSYCSVQVLETNVGHATEKTALAWVSDIGGKYVYMLQGSYEHDTRGILMHELGHILGAQHVPGTLMNDKWIRHLYDCPDATTVAQVAAWNRIDIDTLSWCTH